MGFRMIDVFIEAAQDGLPPPGEGAQRAEGGV